MLKGHVCILFFWRCLLYLYTQVTALKTYSQNSITDMVFLKTETMNIGSACILHVCLFNILEGSGTLRRSHSFYHLIRTIWLVRKWKRSNRKIRRRKFIGIRNQSVVNVQFKDAGIRSSGTSQDNKINLGVQMVSAYTLEWQSCD